MISIFRKFAILFFCICCLPSYSFSGFSLDNFDCNLEDSEDVQDFNDIVDVYKNNNDLNSLLKIYSICIKHNPDLEFLYTNRGRINIYLKKYENALSDYNKALELKNDEIFALYGKMYIYTIQNKFDEAIEISKKIIELNQNFAGVYYNKGLIYLSKKDYKKSIENLKKCLFCLQNTPKWKFEMMFFSMGDIHYNLASAYYNNKNSDKALYHFQQALKCYKIEKNEQNIKSVIDIINKLTSKFT